MSADDARVHAYLDDVARMLAGIDPAERAEILAGLREHIDAAVVDRQRPADRPRAADDDPVLQVLTELGPPDRVAAAALADLEPVRAQHSGPAAAAVRPLPPLTQPWVPVTAGLLMALSVALYLVVLVATLAFVVAEQSAATPPVALAAPSGTFSGPVLAEVTQNPALPASYDIVWAAFAPLPLVGLPWLLSTILLASSPLWTTGQKWTGAFVVPALAVACGVLVWLVTLFPPSVTRSVVLVVAGTAVAAAAVWVVAQLWRDGASRARDWGAVPVDV